MDAIAWTHILETAAVAFGAAIVLLLPWELWRLHRAGRLDRARVREMLASTSPLLPTILLGGVVTAFVLGLYAGVAALVPWSIPTNGFTVLLALLAVDFM